MFKPASKSPKRLPRVLGNLSRPPGRTYKILVAVCSILVTAAVGYLFVRAGSLNPGSGPGDTMKTLEDIYCKQLYGCTPTSYSTDSPATPGETMKTLTEIYEQVPAFPEQEHQMFDDWNCNGAAGTGNNDESSSTCAELDPEYVGEEASWSSSTDATPPTGILDSGKVYKDSRTGLYWSDKATSTIKNQFATTSEQCDDSKVADGTCDPCTWITQGAAISLCCNLDLDCSANGCSSSTDWRLPTQKELMQAYIDGAANNLPSPNTTFWSSTEKYDAAANAWGVYLAYGGTNSNLKTVNYGVRCVRP